MKTLLPIALFAIISAVSLVTPAQAEIPPEKRAEIEKMLKVTGMEKMMDQMKVQMISGLKAQLSSAPNSFWDKFQQKMDVKELIEMIMPIYDKYYSVEDIKAINTFYGTEAGKKMLSSLPQIMQESMKIGQEWGMKISEQAFAEIEKEKKK